MSIIKIKINNDEKELNFLNDFLFHKMFGEKGCEEDTLELVNIITGEKFRFLDFKSTEMYGKHEGNKKSVTDVMTITNDGTVISIEAQIKEQEEFHKRSHFYHSRIFSILLEIGDDYDKLPKIIMINLLDFDLHELEDYHTIFTLCEKKHKYILDDITETHYIELPKFRTKIKKGNIDLSDPKIRLMLILDNQTNENLFKKVIEMDEYANNLYEKAKHVLQDKASYLEYIRAEHAELDRKAELKFADKKGRDEEKKEIATRMKNKGYSIEDIVEITGLTPEVIEKL